LEEEEEEEDVAARSTTAGDSFEVSFFFEVVEAVATVLALSLPRDESLSSSEVSKLADAIKLEGGSVSSSLLESSAFFDFFFLVFFVLAEEVEEAVGRCFVDEARDFFLDLEREDFSEAVATPGGPSSNIIALYPRNYKKKQKQNDH